MKRAKFAENKPCYADRLSDPLLAHGVFAYVEIPLWHVDLALVSRKWNAAVRSIPRDSLSYKRLAEEQTRDGTRLIYCYTRDSDDAAQMRIDSKGDPELHRGRVLVWRSWHPDWQLSWSWGPSLLSLRNAVTYYHRHSRCHTCDRKTGVEWKQFDVTDWSTYPSSDPFFARCGIDLFYHMCPDKVFVRLAVCPLHAKSDTFARHK
jgi:hypothetical protein